MNLYTTSSKQEYSSLKKLITFIILCIIALIVVSAITKITIINTIQDSSNFVLPKNASTIVVGDSYMMTNLIPDEENGIYNGAKRAEILPFTCQKVYFICEHNPQIENIVISLSYMSLTMEREIGLRDPESIKHYSESFFSLYDHHLKEITFAWNMDYLISWCKYTLGVPFEISKELGLIWKIKLSQQGYFDYPFWGGFQVVPAVKEDLNVKARVEKHFKLDAKEAEMSKILIDYIKNLNEYCKDKGIRLIAVNTPKYEEFENLIPECYKTAQREIITDLELQNENFHYLNFEGMKLSREFLRDADHLNYDGAKFFTKKLNKEINAIISIQN